MWAHAGTRPERRFMEHDILILLAAVSLSGLMVSET